MSDQVRKLFELENKFRRSSFGRFLDLEEREGLFENPSENPSRILSESPKLSRRGSIPQLILCICTNYHYHRDSSFKMSQYSITFIYLITRSRIS